MAVMARSAASRPPDHDDGGAPRPRRSARLDEILSAAERIVEDEGVDALTMRRLGEQVGMRAPSLYKHVASKEDLLAELQAQALASMGAELVEAGPDLGALARRYRAWALAHPGLYELGTRRQLARDRLPGGLEDWAAAPLVEAVGGDEHRARALWAAAHGLVDLELADRYPPGADLDAAWGALVAAFTGGES
jgi:AcrR family transcriptional regulator